MKMVMIYILKNGRFGPYLQYEKIEEKMMKKHKEKKENKKT